MLFIFICFGYSVFAQEKEKDSIKIKIPNYETKNYDLPYNTYSATLKQISVRVGAGLQDSFYTEIGATLHECTYGCTGFFSKGFYSAIEWVPTKNDDIYGLKVGCEFNAFLLNLGLELKYQTDFTYKDIVITPKIGLGMYGDINIFYGYNISTYNSPFPNINNHQLSIILNLNRHFLGYM